MGTPKRNGADTNDVLLVQQRRHRIVHPLIPSESDASHLAKKGSNMAVDQGPQYLMAAREGGKQGGLKGGIIGGIIGSVLTMIVCFICHYMFGM
jgi:hypothetical protein